MTDHDPAVAVRPLTLAWVGRHLEAGERIVRTEALHGGITAEMRRLTIGTRDGDTRALVRPPGVCGVDDCGHRRDSEGRRRGGMGRGDQHDPQARAALCRVQLVSRPWREAGRTELTTRVVEERLDAYVTALIDAPS